VWLAVADVNRGTPDHRSVSPRKRLATEGGGGEVTLARSRARVKVGGVLVALAVTFTACGANDSETDGSSSSRPPIKVMQVAQLTGPLTSLSLNATTVASVYQEWINAKGGINGRPLEITVCDEAGDPNKAAACAREAAEEDVVAVVGSFVFNDQAFIPLLEREGIAYFGSVSNRHGFIDTSPISFPLVPGSLTTVSPAAVAAKNCTTGIGLLTVSPTVKDALEPLLASQGAKISNYVLAPVKTVDWTAPVAQVSSGTDCLFFGLADSQMAAVAAALSKSGLAKTHALYTADSLINIQLIEEFPDIHGWVVGPFPEYESDAFSTYRSAMEQYSGKEEEPWWSSSNFAGVWGGFAAFTDIVEDLTDVTPEAFLDAASKATNVSSDGLTPPVDFSRSAVETDEFRRIFNPTMYVSEFGGGKSTMRYKFSVEDYFNDSDEVELTEVSTSGQE
jgi:ABC-type branched-subunit amino acid transport system substrate-binding protein